MFTSAHLNTKSDAPIISVGGGHNSSWLMAAPTAPSTSAAVITALAGVVLIAVIFYGASSGCLKSPWSRRRRKHAISPQQWKGLFAQDGRLSDGGAKFLKRVRSGFCRVLTPLLELKFGHFYLESMTWIAPKKKEML